MTWIKFEDKKPDEEQIILVCLGTMQYGSKMDYVQYGRYSSKWNPNGYFFPDFYDYQDVDKPKYWMPLPELPEDT